MNIEVGLLLAAAMGGWVYYDARSRNSTRPLLWGVATFLLAIVFLPAWLITRPPKGPVTRTGPRRCPFCNNPVQLTAVSCMHCGKDI